MAYNNIVYQASYLHDEITFYLREARRIFLDDLCLALPDILIYLME